MIQGAINVPKFGGGLLCDHLIKGPLLSVSQVEHIGGLLARTLLRNPVRGLQQPLTSSAHQITAKRRDLGTAQTGPENLIPFFYEAHGTPPVVWWLSIPGYRSKVTGDLGEDKQLVNRRE